MAKADRRQKSTDQTLDIRPEGIEDAILLLRGQKVLLDRDLARLYGVATGNLNKAVQRNLTRFPGDFMFQLTIEEAESSRFHFGSLNRGHNFKYLPYAFTEQGVAMLPSVLRSHHPGLHPRHHRAPKKSLRPIPSPRA